MQFLFAAFLAMAITMLIIPPLMQMAGRIGVLDLPGGRRTHDAPIPRVGGIAMAIGMLVAMLLWGSLTVQMKGYLLALPILLVFGIQDDRIELAPAWKLVGQMLAALVVMYVGDMHVGVWRHADVHEVPQWLSVPITLMFIVGVTNAINLADGLDGLAGGVTLVCLSGLLMLALTGSSPQVAFLCMVSMGAVLGFMRYNTYPARIFMGDAGSQVLGFSAAVFSLILTQDRELPYSGALPLLLLGMPVMDTLTVMTERMLDGKSPFKADRLHIHHRLLGLGFRHHEAVIVIYGAQILLLVLAWYLRYASDLVIVAAFAAVTVSILVALRVAHRRQWQWRAVPDGTAPAASRLGGWFIIGMDGVLGRWSTLVMAGAMGAYGVLLLVAGAAASIDVRILSIACALVMVSSVLTRRKQVTAGWLERAVCYICVLIAVTLDRPLAQHGAAYFTIELVIFGLLTLSLGVYLYASRDRRFQVTPMDVLVVLVALALPNLPGSIVGAYTSGPVIIKALLLLYGVESLSLAHGVAWRMLTRGTALFLAMVAVLPWL